MTSRPQTSSAVSESLSGRSGVKRARASARVAIISPMGYNGIAYYAYSLCEALHRIGVEVVLLSSDRWILEGHPASFRRLVSYKGASGERSRIEKGLNYVVSSIRVFWQVMRERANVAHFQVIELPPVDALLMLALRLAGRRVVYTPHDIVHVKRFFLNELMTRAMYRLAHRVVVHNASNREKLVLEYPWLSDKIRIIAQGGFEYFVPSHLDASSARRAVGIGKEGRYIFFIGNTKRDKGLEVLIEAMSILRKSIPDVRLMIAGRLTDGLTEEWVSGLVSRFGVSDIVEGRFAFIPDDLIVSYYLAGDVVALPYNNISESAVLRFAQSCGKVIVCSDLPEFKTSVEDGVTGFTFRRGDARHLAAVLGHALSDRSAGRVGQAARSLTTEKFGWLPIANGTRQMYDEMVFGAMEHSPQESE